MDAELGELKALHVTAKNLWVTSGMTIIWVKRKLLNCEHTRVKASQIEDDVLGVDDVEGGKQVRRVDV